MLTLCSFFPLTLVFAPYYSPNHTLLPQMLAFIACHLLCVAMGIYKCWSMGLLPTESSDWLAWYVAPQVRTKHDFFLSLSLSLSFSVSRMPVYSNNDQPTELSASIV